MGNKCSLNKNKDDDETLSDYDKTIYIEKREKVFYGTIAICVLYASFALLLFIASYLSEKVKFILLNNFLPFVIVYIIGTIIIVFYLIHQVVNFKPFKINRNSKYDNLSCPDYWTLEKIPITDDNKSTFKDIFSSNVNNELFKYRCVMDPKIFDRYNIYKANETNGFKETATTKIVADQDPYYKFTTADITTTDNNKLSTQPTTDYSNKHLFVNILNTNLPTSNLVYNNILQKDKIQKYELIKNTLIMNNYKLLDDTTAIKVFKYADLTLASSLKVDILNYDKNTTSDVAAVNGDSAVDNKTALLTAQTDKPIIKVDTSNNNTVYYHATNISPTITSGTDTELKVLPMVCDNTYPMYLASRDEITNKTNDKFDNNIFRCAYSKICKVPWSDMNCDKYDS
jgi:hypothetical protein